MYSIPSRSSSSYYEMGMRADSVSLFQGVLSSVAASSVVEKSSSATAEAKAAAASKSHSEAERRRRKRINAHLATLRTLLPNTTKRDKASLLAEVVRRLRELEKTTAELAAGCGGDEGGQSSGGAKQCGYMFPSEADELKVCYCEGDSGTIRATLCCEDRPKLVSEVARAVRSVAGKVVRAEMATVGGRTMSVLWVKMSGGGADGGEGRLRTVRQALKAVLDRVGLSSGSGQAFQENKRVRLSDY
ncbi:hypothetical protein U1Q18_011320 [Sarracenia purpurea var. burkii]